jgi:hypothetical protein
MKKQLDQLIMLVYSCEDDKDNVHLDLKQLDVLVLAGSCGEDEDSLPLVEQATGRVAHSLQR